MLPVDRAVAFEGFEGNELGIVHHGLGQHGFDELRTRALSAHSTWYCGSPALAANTAKARE